MSKNIQTKENISRIIIGISIALLTGFIIYLGGWFLTIGMIVILWQANTEFINIVRLKGFNPSNKWIRFVSIAFLLIASLPLIGFSQNSTIKLFIFVFILGVIGCFFRFIFRGNKSKPIASIPDISTSVLGFVYTGLLPSFLILLRELGTEYALIAAASIAFCDTGAYFGGKLFGKTALKPQISAGKTLEGAISGFIISMIASITLVYFTRESFENNILHGVIIGLFTGIFSQFGDFFESLLKRDAGVKDSGKVLFSHGGFLDRLDSYFFVFWVIYFYTSWVILKDF